MNNEISSIGEIDILEKSKSEIDFDRNISKILKEWDVEFSINQEVLYNILNYIYEINSDFVIKFYENRIFIQCTNKIQYAEVCIHSNFVSGYKPGLEGYQNLHNDIHISEKGEYKGDQYKAVIVDFGGIKAMIKNVMDKDDLAIIRIDTSRTAIMEIIMAGGIRFWVQTVYCTPEHPIKMAVEKLPDIIKRVRTNSDIKKAKVEIEPDTFARMCATFKPVPVGHLKRDIDKRIFIKLGKNGLEVTSGDKKFARLFEIKKIDKKIDSENSSYKSDEELDKEITKVENELNTHGKENKAERKLDLLYRLEVDSDQIVYLQSKFILPFLRLKGLSLILIEVRNNKPIYIQQDPMQGVRVMLTVAPRIENEDEI